MVAICTILKVEGYDLVIVRHHSFSKSLLTLRYFPYIQFDTIFEGYQNIFFGVLSTICTNSGIILTKPVIKILEKLYK